MISNQELGGMDKPEYAIENLDEGHLPEVLRICAQELGADYHTEADFRQCLGSGGEHICQVALDGQGAVRGFAVALLTDPGAADEFLKLPASQERDRLLALGRIGILDAAAMDREHQGRGLGRVLVQALRSRLREQGAEVLCSMAWKSVHGKTNAAKLLKESGLEEMLAIQGYWNQVVDSPEGHQCPVCGEPPCRCYGVLYARYLERG
eukprot:TRINITY_DN30783_c1_g2_i1.p3 TRINITY_DN30783_c1_g2~~TRINITY_DN30783_c1_g2_i1.p3  ORF type:complete len:208 (-),score=78.28 TRINITY_DN30783_c1_g2_i1:552-1175(-)